MATQALAGDDTSCARYLASLSEDLVYRDSLAQTEVPEADWNQPHFGDWGPPASWYPPVHAPNEYHEVDWLRSRIIEISKRYLGMAYTRSHIPQNGGLDCSNFTSWVYNFGTGIRIASNVERQSMTAGRLLAGDEPLKPGDLIFLYSKDGTRIVHVAIYVNDKYVIDSTRNSGVRMNHPRGWYRRQFAWARRVFE